MPRNSRDAAERERKLIDDFSDALTTLAVTERGDMMAPHMRFFDGALIGRGDLLSTYIDMFNAKLGKGRREVEVFLNAHRGVHGSFVLAQEGCRYAVVGSRELGQDEKKLIAPFFRPTVEVVGDSGLVLRESRLVDATKVRIVECRSVNISNNGVATTTDRNYFHRNPRNRLWYPYKPEKTLNGGRHGFSSLAFDAAAVRAFLADEFWDVRLRIDPVAPSVSFFTDATGVKSFFTLRDVAPGRARRDALLHWVAEHWRKSRRDPEMETYVREHMRGKGDFSWGGMSAEIRLPSADVDRVAASRERRKRTPAAELVRRRVNR